MKKPTLLKQRGAVLAFTLVMLLLLTLVGVSMIQQNKQELGMAGNARQQTQALATVESALSNAETAIDAIRYDLGIDPTSGIARTKNDHFCNTAPQLDEEDVLTAVTTAVATIKEVYCLTNYWTAESGGTEQRCVYHNEERDPDNTACDRLNRTGTNLGCPIELYTIHTTFTDSKGTQRTVESKYAVDCTGNSG